MNKYLTSTIAKSFMYILLWAFIMVGMYGNIIAVFTVDLFNIGKEVPYRLFYSIYIFITFMLGAVITVDTVCNIILKILTKE